MKLKDPTVILSTGEEIVIPQPSDFETMYDVTVMIVKSIYKHFEAKERNITRAYTKTAGECGYSDPSSIRRIIG